MKRFVICLLALVISATALKSAEDSALPPIAPVLKKMLKGYIHPGYAAFEAAASDLETSVTTLCGAPSNTSLETARVAFRAVADRWARMEWLRIGPVMSDNRLERILFFPDRKGTGRKQVQRAITSENEAVTDVNSLAGQSVALQGLGALEYLMFGGGSDALATGPQFSHRCAFAEAAAANLLNLSEEMIAGWQEGAALVPVFLEPGPDNPLYRTDQEALNLLLGQMIHGLEAIRDIRLSAFVDKESATRDRPKSALFWRSGMTLPTIAANLEGLEAMFNESGIEIVSTDMAPRLAATIRFEFRQAIRTAKSLDAPISELLANPETKDKLVYLDYAIKIIIERLDQEFAQAGGLAVGFSFGDGD